MSDNKLPNNIDKHVGRRVRWRRRELNFSQEHLGGLLGLTFQQIQKYEKGVNRISAGRLYQICIVMGVRITYFYDGLDEIAKVVEGIEGDGEKKITGLINADSVDLLTAFQSINDDGLKKSILDMINSAEKALR